MSTIDTMEVSGADVAEVSVTVGMAGTGGVYGLSADAYRFELELEKPGGDWMLIGAKWGELGKPLR